jgi:GntR family transcriptional regulator, transcriptional repressor for pyruvate dehydrogenase complex
MKRQASHRQSKASTSALRGLLRVSFRPVSRRTPIDEVVSQIAEAVWVGELRQGDRLPAERSFAETLDVSRPTLRLAFRRLEEAGVLEVSRGRGGGARIRSQVVPLALLGALPEVTRAEISGLLEARRAIEPRVAQLAALHATEEDLDHLAALVEHQRKAPPDWSLHGQLDAHFHLELARATHNSTLFVVMRELLLRLAVARSSLLRSPHDAKTLANIHETTLRAVAGGDPNAVERAMNEHLGWLERVWERESGRPRMRGVPEFLLPAPVKAAAMPGSGQNRRRTSA